MNYLLIVVGFAFGILVDILSADIANKKKIKTKIGKYRTHHTVHALVIIIVGLFLWGDFLIPFGLGMIFWHTVRLKRIVFIEKAKKRGKGKRR